MNKDKTKILLALTAAELAGLDDEQVVLLELDKPNFLVSGTLTRLNPDRHTVVVAFEAPDDRFAVKQQVRFLSAFTDFASSPLGRSYAQYQQYPDPIIEGTAGAFFEGQTDKLTSGKDSPAANTEKSGQTASGTKLEVYGYLPLPFQWLGLALDYERRDGEVSITSPSTSTSMTLTYNRISPGLWLALNDHDWRLGLRYDYTDISQVYRGSAPGTYSYSLGQIAVGLLHYTTDEEVGIDFISPDDLAETAYSTPVPGQAAVATTLIYKASAELFVYFRKVLSPTLTWGLGAGYIFYNTSNGYQAPDATPSPEQVIRLRATMESRAADGDKWTWMLTYDGGHAKALSTLDQDANEGGLNVSYETYISDHVLVGVELSAGAGVAVVTDQLTSSNGTEAANRQIIGYRFSALAVANYAFESPKKKGR